MDTVATPVMTASLTDYCARLPNWRDLAPTPDAFAARCSLVRMKDDAMVGVGMPCDSFAIVMTEQDFPPATSSSRTPRTAISSAVSSPRTALRTFPSAPTPKTRSPAHRHVRVRWRLVLSAARE